MVAKNCNQGRHPCPSTPGPFNWVLQKLRHDHELSIVLHRGKNITGRTILSDTVYTFTLFEFNVRLCWTRTGGRPLESKDTGPHFVQALICYIHFMLSAVIILFFWFAITKNLNQKVVWALWSTTMIWILQQCWFVTSMLLVTDQHLFKGLLCLVL